MCAKYKETIADFLVGEKFVKDGRCKVHQPQRDCHVRQLLKLASRTLIVPITRSGGSIAGGSTRYAKILCDLEQPVLLNVLGKLGNENAAVFCKARSSTRRRPQLISVSVWPKNSFPAVHASLKKCEIEILSLLWQGWYPSRITAAHESL